MCSNWLVMSSNWRCLTTPRADSGKGVIGVFVTSEVDGRVGYNWLPRGQVLCHEPGLLLG